MAAKEMYDYLSDVVADYTVVELSVTPHVVLSAMGDKTQQIHSFDDGSVGVVSLSDTSYFEVTLQWARIPESDAGTILDLWHDSAKANGRENTFYWQHPTDGHTYVARFMGPLSRQLKAEFGSTDMAIPSITLRIEGRKTGI